MTVHVPDLLTERRLYPPSIALSKDLMVSRGLSQRGRVGLERSGSAVEGSATRCQAVGAWDLTY